MKSVIVLSEKSSGSTAIQDLLAKFADLKHVQHTHHWAFETLYWSLAASILEMPQTKIPDSVVPVPKVAARDELIALVRNNSHDFIPPQDDKDLVMNGWRHLCEAHAPIFLEKSPHHLCQQSSLDLIAQWMDVNNDIDTVLIGLVRNPMDTIYSQYARWRARPEALEGQWRTAYKNLLTLKDRVGDRVYIIRYEDLIQSTSVMEPVFNAIGVEADLADHNHMHQKSIQKWRADNAFGFALSEETITLAEQYGYQRTDMHNQPTPLWPLRREATRVGYKIKAKLGFA